LSAGKRVIVNPVSPVKFNDGKYNNIFNITEAMTTVYISEAHVILNTEGPLPNDEGT
jgi:hypothetical protein